MTISVGNTGRPIFVSQSHAETIARAGVMGTMAVLGLGLVLWITRILVRRILIQRHLADWEAHWSAFGPKWTERPGT